MEDPDPSLQTRPPVPGPQSLRSPSSHPPTSRPLLSQGPQPATLPPPDFYVAFMSGFPFSAEELSWHRPCAPDSFSAWQGGQHKPSSVWPLVPDNLPALDTGCQRAIIRNFDFQSCRRRNDRKCLMSPRNGGRYSVQDSAFCPELVAGDPLLGAGASD